MKQIIFLSFWAMFGAFVTHQALADTVIIDDKEFQVVEIDGEKLVSNEWQPTTEQGYTDEYRASEQYQTVKAANETLRRIKDGEL
ncbi:hypothetical protein FQV37_2244 [Psychrobacter nivimaris]|uniref:Uncharacterized protein n=1 Tax=Psychrobacter nivimaris TaxID=281738 RepID=A0A6N7BSV6_9GAMM|nr:hypothetical protein [Psychrobacter nivimaris]KAF0567388.1 hypothetical protein FQV37_2244 [Psychrobacter nivimaris]